MPADETAPFEPSAAPSASVLEAPGTQIGPYKLISLLGEGGFGVVWLAERHDPVLHRVALKIVKPGMDSKSVLARFQQEQQVLALMSHPCIAQVLDGGMTPTGRPYFAMEYVQGEPINTYCDRNRLSISDRLRLFDHACQAVSHAHLKGVVHRDLKPSNILAYDMEGAEPGLKVIDFGVAKALTPGTSGHSVHTEAGQMIGTPEYMSPEQAEIGGGGVDTRSDVYSLGVLLYELLSGALPFESSQFRNRAFREVQRIIQEQDPPTPSARLSTIATKDGERRSQIERARGIRVSELVRNLRGELEWIPLKAMRKAAHERYQSVADLSRDVHNYLNNRPLLAAPESGLYRFRKYAGRHRTQVIAATVVVATVAASAVILAWQRSQAVAARDLAALREREALTVTSFLMEALIDSDPMRGGRKDITVSQAMRHALTRIEDGMLADEPLVEARIQLTIAQVLRGSNENDTAIQLASRALATLEKAPAADQGELALAMDILAVNYCNAEQFELAEPLLRRSLAICQDQFGTQCAQYASTLSNLAVCLNSLGKPNEAEPLLREALSIREQVLKPDDPQIAWNLGDLAGACSAQKHLDEAIQIHLRAMAAMDKSSQPPAMVASELRNLAACYTQAGKHTEADPLYQRALKLQRDALGAGHIQVARTLQMMAWSRFSQKDFAAAESLALQALAIFQDTAGATDRERSDCMDHLATLYRSTQRPAEAEKYSAMAAEARRTRSPASSPAGR